MSAMRISTRGRYAVRVMLDLALYGQGEYVKARQIAKRQGISEKYLEQIIAVLNKAGFVQSVRGAQGGYCLADSPENYTVGQILRLTIQGKGFVARYAGDEFIVIRSISDPQEMVDLMDAIHRGTEQFNAAGTKPYKVSLSMGFSVFRAEGDSVDDFLRRMDEGMYQEKRRKNLAR